MSSPISVRDRDDSSLPIETSTMRLLYSYTARFGEGSTVHIGEFVRAFGAHCGAVVENSTVIPPFREDKSTWPLRRRIWARTVWARRNIDHLVRTWRAARKSSAEVLLFRFAQDHTWFLATFVLSFVYPVVLEVNSIRSLEEPDAGGTANRVLDELTMRAVARSFTVSEVLRAHMVNVRGFPADKIAVVENGVDIDSFKQLVSPDVAKARLGILGTFAVGFVGSLKRWHGVDALVNVAKKVVGRIPNVRFVIVGDGDARPALEAQVESAGLRAVFLFTGHVSHEKVVEVLGGMDVMTAPYKRESLSRTGEFYFSPLKIFEYMAMGKAVIASPFGQIKQLIEDGVSGRLIHIEDDETVAEELVRLYRDAEYRMRLGANARSRIEERYTWKINAEKVLSVCRSAEAEFECK
ncbi:MAG: glycosyltransferase family 4 protein [Gammaproteobacteria bacterium]